MAKISQFSAPGNLKDLDACGASWSAKISGFLDAVLRLFRTMRKRRGNELGMPSVVWKSISFSTAGLKLLRPSDDIQANFDGKFLAGMFNDSLQDPPADQWKIGGSAQTVPHVLIVLAADKQSDLDAETSRLIKGIGESGGGGLPAHCGWPVRRKRRDVAPPLRAHELFGFKDGVSQPAIWLDVPDPADFFDEASLVTGGLISIALRNRGGRWWADNF
jgi:deferrochelatase/peroxidase EfeB